MQTETAWVVVAEAYKRMGFLTTMDSLVETFLHCLISGPGCI